MNRAWYRIVLESPRGTILVAAPGEELGAAIAGARSRLAAAWPLAVTPARPDEVPLGESIGKGVVVLERMAEAGAGADASSPFRWPPGVVPSRSATAAMLAPIDAGWVRHPSEVGVVLEAQLPDPALGEAWFELIERLPTVDNIEVKLMDHYDDDGGATEVWLSPRVDVRKAIRFIDDHDRELLHNGHVELSFYLRGEKSTLRLTEHKTIVWISEDPSTAARIGDAFAALKVPPRDRLVTIGAVPHFHYRDPSAGNRKKLSERLGRLRLKRVATLTQAPSE